MQVEFVISAGAESQEFHFEKKVGTLFKGYKPRVLQVGVDCLKYLGGDGKESESLVGATVFASPNGADIRLKFKDKKEPAIFRAKSGVEGETFVNQTKKAIRRANAQALRDGRHDAEVIEWYYQYQADLAKETAFMMHKHVLHMLSEVPGQNAKRTSHFHVTMTADRSGLLFTLDRTMSDGNAPSRFASLYNGRIVPFSDITGVFLPSGKFATEAGGGLSFVLQTKEDQLSLFLPTKGIEWLRAVQALCVFTKIPVPSSRSTGHAQTHHTLADFTAHSGTAFAPSSDVLLILQQMADRPGQAHAVIELCEEISGVLRGIPDARCNREAMHVFGGRVEDAVRVFGSADGGIIYHVREDQRSAFDAKVVTLKTAFADIRAYLKTQRYAGWLRHHIDSTANARTTLETLDANLMAVLNTLISMLQMDNSLMFEKKEYSCAADVRKSVESLGGLDVIYQDTIKERTLAKLVQSDGAEVARELAKMHGVVFTGSQKSLHSSFTGMEDANVENTPPPRAWWYYLCCCCLCSCCCADAAAATKTKKKASPSLQEPLVHSP